MAGRLAVRRIPEVNSEDGQGTLFDTWRFHAFLTTADPAVLDTVAADPPRPHALVDAFNDLEQFPLSARWIEA